MTVFFFLSSFDLMKKLHLKLELDRKKKHDAKKNMTGIKKLEEEKK